MAQLRINSGSSNRRDPMNRQAERTFHPDELLNATPMYRITRFVGVCQSIYTIVLAGLAFAEFPGAKRTGEMTTKIWLWLVFVPIAWSLAVYLGFIMFGNRMMRRTTIDQRLRGHKYSPLFSVHAIESAVHSAVNFAFIFALRAHFKKTEIEAFDKYRYDDDADIAPLDTNLYIAWAGAMLLVIMSGVSEITSQLKLWFRVRTERKS